ncbi:molybdate ABC transporter substrate-binding protein [bacterium]|nr:MAG: molybdate ABC transporter substrate-binding protein [bacterium]
MGKMKSAVLLLTAFTLFGTALPSSAAKLQEVRVGAAASLSTVLKEEAGLFEKANPEVKISFNFGASGALYRQLLEGGAMDGVIFADVETWEKAVKAGLVSGSPVTVAKNSLVLAVNSSLGDSVSSAEDLTKSEVKRITTGNPEYVPLGRYARDSLAGTGIWEGISGKTVLASSAEHAVQYLKSGEADAAFIYLSDAKKLDAGYRIIPVKSAKEVLYVAGAVSSSKNSGGLESFIKFLTSKEGAAVFSSHGFKVP